MIKFSTILSLLFSWCLHAEDFHIGGIAILSGIASQYGTHAQQGAILALEDLESKKDPHQPHLKISWQDETNGKAERASLFLRRFALLNSGYMEPFAANSYVIFEDSLPESSTAPRSDQE
jgi:hypothetical protein